MEGKNPFQHHSKFKSRLITLSLSALCTISASVSAADLSVADSNFTVTSAISLSENTKKSISVNSDEKATYIVRMDAPAVASYDGGIADLQATNAEFLGLSVLDVNAPASKRYSSFLKDEQSNMVEHCEKAFGRKLNVKYTYQHAFNGVAMELTADEAKRLVNLSNIISVEKEHVEYLNTDAGPKWISAQRLWKGRYPWEHNYLDLSQSDMILDNLGSRGEGAVVAILDSGINHDHPSFAATGGDGYEHVNPLGSGNFIPGSYCDTNPDFCNDKLIGAWDMVQSELDPDAPEDSDGHGSHTASTTAGNVVKDATLYAPTTELVRDVSGVAPHANIIAYDVCIDSCPGSALLAAIEQVVIDASNLPNGIQALNYSISGGTNPYNDSVELGFLNATAAGIYVAASAGNSGPDAATVAHVSPWVSTTAAMTHNRKIENSLVDLQSDDASLSGIVGAGFTAGYGPAAIVYAGDYPTADGTSNETDPAQCLEPFPVGHFNGEIVICDRGAIARTAKGEHVLAGGAGGYVLANAEANGESVTGDAHFLPGIHLGFTDGQMLKDWVAANTNTMGSIAGYALNTDRANGDITAGFSSRGPNNKLAILKPDIGGPGVDIMAAVSSAGGGDVPEYAFLSGTSMSSPHNAGSGALVSMLTNWNPYEIKSAIMMTSKNTKLFKDDGVTKADPFDVGAGRIDLGKVLKSGLVLNETPENFFAANPESGGDPESLNIASMQSNQCVGVCTWTRTVTHTSEIPGMWVVSAKSDGMDVSVSPSQIHLLEGESATLTITADTFDAPEGWNFGEIKLRPYNKSFAKLHMPIAVNVARSSSTTLVKTVDKSSASKGEIVTYEISVNNTTITDPIELNDMLPNTLSFVDGSITTSISNGSEISPAALSNGQVNWNVVLDPGGLSLEPSLSPFGYFALASLGVAPAACPSNCDDGASIYSGLPEFEFNGQMYSEVIMSVNGVLEVGSASGLAASATPQALPDVASPSNLIAPLWTDLNLGAGGNWYVGVLNAGPSQFIVFEWENVPFYGDTTTNTFQIWIEAGTSNIWVVHADVTSLPYPTTVGVENANGTVGSSYFAGGEGIAPTSGTELQVLNSAGGVATLSFQAEIESCKRRDGKLKVNEVYMNAGDLVERAYATTMCAKKVKPQ